MTFPVLAQIQSQTYSQIIEINRKMADEQPLAASDAHSLAHPSIHSDSGTCDFSLVRCGRANCGDESCCGGMYHCPLCPPGKFAKEIPSRVKDHFKKVHWENRIHEFPGILRFLSQLRLVLLRLV